MSLINWRQVGPSPRSKIFNKSGDDAACTTSVWFMSSSPARAGTHCLLVSQLPSWAPPDLHRAAAAHFFPDSKLIESFEDRISRDFSIHIFDRHREIRLYSVSEYCHVICIFLCNYQCSLYYSLLKFVLKYKVNIYCFWYQPQLPQSGRNHGITGRRFPDGGLLRYRK